MICEVGDRIWEKDARYVTSPIVNGRCKYCGMPYRNDAVMYHLNEDRSEHYRHSSAKVRREMDQSEIPLLTGRAARIIQRKRLPRTREQRIKAQSERL